MRPALRRLTLLAGLALPTAGAVWLLERDDPQVTLPLLAAALAFLLSAVWSAAVGPASGRHLLALAGAAALAGLGTAAAAHAGEPACCRLGAALGLLREATCGPRLPCDGWGDGYLASSALIAGLAALTYPALRAALARSALD